MPTGTLGTDARRYQTNQEHYITAQVAFNTTGITTGIVIGTLPASAIVTRWVVHVTTAFNAATTNVLEVGTNSATFNDIAATASTVAGTAGVKSGDAAGSTARGRFAADTPVRAIYTQTGTAATTGAAEIIVFYVVPQ
jgi:hypothetical protein